MEYKSTRSKNVSGVSSAFAIKSGLAPDGGLYMPERLPHIDEKTLHALSGMTYPERAAEILSMFLSDYTKEELLKDCRAAYSEDNFPGGATQIVNFAPDMYSLELWHGPTCAFKDMALQIMPRLLSSALRKTGEKRTALILVATSGDTGKAALEGYKNTDRIKIQVFYPENGVSRVQKLQMATQTGDNVDVCAIKGNFDDAQTGVKRIFSDASVRAELDAQGVFLSSANSINWGRLAPQIVYYISAYCDLAASGKIKYGDEINVCVPTGNFGNIFAAYIANLMGLPIGHLICASNKNNILTDFLSTGVYDRNRDFYTTISPSMDILISSNLERLLYLICGPEATGKYMKELAEKGRYEISGEDFAKIKEKFIGYFADEDKTKSTIKATYEKHGYLIDPHTAVAVSAAEDFIKDKGNSAPIIIASTASPYKFAKDVYSALSGKSAKGDLEALGELSAMTGVEIPGPLRGIGDRKIRFDKVTDPEGMADMVMSFAKK